MLLMLKPIDVKTFEKRVETHTNLNLRMQKSSKWGFNSFQLFLGLNYFIFPR